jgi:hypothetical protein
MNPLDILKGMAGGGIGGSSGPADAGNYAPVMSNGTTGAFNFGSGAGTASSPIPIELIAIVGLFAWLMLSKR